MTISSVLIGYRSSRIFILVYIYLYICTTIVIHIYKTKDRLTLTPLKTGDELHQSSYQDIVKYRNF